MDIDEQIRFKLDVSLFDELMSDEKVKTLADKRTREMNTIAYRRDLLGNSLRISQKMAPDLFQRVTSAQQKLGLEDKDIELYIYNSPEPNASCAYTGGDNIILTFSSGLLMSMSQDELNFVIGHELGHALFHHYALPTHSILEGKSLTASEAMKVMSWSRRAEISADRAGVYVCQNPSAAISSFLKLSCGVAHPIIEFDLKEYSSQIQDLSELANSLEDTSHCYSSHPFNPIRVMAVDLYGQSDRYKQLTGQGSAEKTLSEIDDAIKQVLDYMEPVTDNDKQQMMNEAVFWGGAWVAYADGVLANEEAENLLSQAGQEVFDRGMEQINASADPVQLAKDNFTGSCKPLLVLGPSERCSFIQRLVVVARADQNIDDSEMDALMAMADIMKVEPSFIQQIMMFLD
ncbi:MAG: hypothetical protein CMI02_19630 [Oceanospirillaceae bacterium]|nr:hypothetical protein [Oceanospirillaceae bacterium]MBT14240.1 hypothetical protein [Oceanospirillaceae bacterium]